MTPEDSLGPGSPWQTEMMRGMEAHATHTVVSFSLGHIG